ncbi:IS481 family transposase [Streptomonospora sp. PA3]|uniref:IS481 family transposase n=2 Tax=Streptomonospora sp. PA3 TaxID=2607326 RepID=UPI0013059C69|nr:IS481 family transposase [Streptomonospora sp. PA3]
MCHRNAPLTPTGRLRLARCVVEDGYSRREAAERFGVSPRTAHRWARRYRDEGEAGMGDRPSRPHHSPARTPAATEQQVLDLRREHRLGPLRLAARTGIGPATCHRILTRRGMAPLAACDRATGEPVRRYERARPGDLVHIDVKKLGRIPDGGGHKVLGRAAGRSNKDTDGRGRGYLFLHTAPDDHSRLAYTEILTDETAPTCAGFLRRAVAWFARRGVTARRVLTDNAWAYTKTTWRTTCRQLGIGPRWTRPWRPQTNGKVERFHLTLLEEWAYQRPYTCEAQRQAAFGDWLDWYNYHRPHTGIGGRTPASRVTNLPGHHT